MTWKVVLALDWWPNTNHTGFYVARSKGWYAEAGLELTLRSPPLEPSLTPASQLQAKTATFALVPSETIISYHTWPTADRAKLVAIATVLQKSNTAVVTLQSSGIDRPAKLDGKRYASYGARYEGQIVQQLILNDGGSGDYQELTPNMLGIWNTVMNGEADATWVFLGWEGILARRAGIDLNVFQPEDYGVPYGYAPVLAVHPDTLTAEPEMVRAFLAASARGFQFAASQPNAAADLLLREVAADGAGSALPWDLDLVHESQIFLSAHYLTPNGDWGEMQMQHWDAFLDFLHSKGLLKLQTRAFDPDSVQQHDGLPAGEDAGAPLERESIDSRNLATNQYLPQPQ